MMKRPAPVSLLWKILLSTSIAITLLFALTGWIVQYNATRMTALSLEDEVRTSFRSYQSLWQARADKLASVSMVFSRMSDVRAAFSTGDQATIRDTAGEIWDSISQEDAIFLVTDPRGIVIASLGGELGDVKQELPVVRAAAAHFPKQAGGFMMQGGHFYQIAVTPVYVSSGAGPALLNVLVAGYLVDRSVALHLKEATGGSDFVFLASGRVIASTLNPADDPQLAAQASPGENLRQIDIGNKQYSVLASPVLDVDRKPLGELRIYRSFEAARARIDMLRRNIIGIWMLSMLTGLAFTYLLARRILEPVRALDLAAAEIGRGNYDFKVPDNSADELGRLAETFNAMCASLRNAREELIRQERIATVGRMSTSLVHDLRNPLAAIYGGAEMLVDDELSPAQVKRLAANIYKSSRRIQELLQDLVDVTRGRISRRELCRLREIVTAACDAYAPIAESQSVTVTNNVPDNLELSLDRSRIERVFVNLVNNALEAMSDGGKLDISARSEDAAIIVEVEDSGPGIAEEIAGRLFQPFASLGKKNGLGLGLALSRQTVLDHGGDMWVDSRAGHGARFFVRLPLRSEVSPAATEGTAASALGVKPAPIGSD
jgi:signal transduction histidine kinase